ncbi:hypothetical protein KIW84_034190 [Lathyrus oleraceus]|uniref:Uncharacterized protein n=1 Tax=Pisum sativum TaxID=3888 RepID=A0A9D4Y3D1_PEA|nr:hypothetical protein KIW84_034190 [Pisum sativum]
MAGPMRPQVVLFGSSIIQMSFDNGGWGGILANLDGVHLSGEGSQVVSKEILRVVREADWKPSLHWMSLPTEFAQDSPYYPPSPDGTTTINVSYSIPRRHLQWDL